MNNTKRSIARITFVLGLALGGFFLWLALKEVDVDSLVRSFRQAELWYCLPFLLALALFYWLKAVRWSQLLAPTREIPSSNLVPSMIVGFAGNNVFPMRLGELIRMYLLSQETRIPKSTVLATIVLERMFDALSILILLVAAMSFSSTQSSELEAARTFLLVATAVAFFAIYAIVFTPQWIYTIFGPLYRHLPEKLQNAIDEKSHLVRQGFASLHGRRSVARIFVNSLVQWILLASCILIAVTAFSVDVPILASVLVLGLVTAGISLPAAPGFVGTIEYCFVLGLGAFGILPTDALAIAIFYHALTFGAVTLSGAFLFRRYNKSWAELRSATEQFRNSEN